jgi:hypothetical protein
MRRDLLLEIGALLAEDPVLEAALAAAGWLSRPKGDPPMVTLPGKQVRAYRRQHRQPFAWPDDLLKRELMIVSASGGVDSSAAVLMARELYPKAMMVLVRVDTGYEPKDSDKVLRALSRKVRAPVITITPEYDLYDLIRYYGRIPNKPFGDWCTGMIKGRELDALAFYLSGGRAKGTTLHTAGLLLTEPARVRRHLREQKARFWSKGKRMMREVTVLDKVPWKRRLGPIPTGRGSKERKKAWKQADKDFIVGLVRKAGIPISTVYLDRTRHGCIPCRWWDPEQWRDFFRIDPQGFAQAANLEAEVAKTGKQGGRTQAAINAQRRQDAKALGMSVKEYDQHRYELALDEDSGWKDPPTSLADWKRRSREHPTGHVFGKLLRIWLPGGDKARYPKGQTLREWLRTWDKELPGWRQAPLEFPNLVRPEDIPCSVPPGSWRLRVLANRIEQGRRNASEFGGWSIRVAVEADGKGLPWVVEHNGVSKRRFHNYNTAWRWMRMMYRKAGGTA